MRAQESVGVSYTSNTDGFLVERIRDGNQDAFEELVQRYSVSLFNFISHFLGDYDQSCDILQQVFLQLYISLPILRTDKSLKSWLFQVARNRCLDELRRKRVVHFSDLEVGNDEDDLPPLFAIPDSSPLPEDLAERHDLQDRLQHAIQLLPPKYRTIVFLRYSSQLSFSEIGKVLQMPEATAKTYFQRAKPMLRANLQEWVESVRR